MVLRFLLDRAAALEGAVLNQWRNTGVISDVANWETRGRVAEARDVSGLTLDSVRAFYKEVLGP